MFANYENVFEAARLTVLETGLPLFLYIYNSAYVALPLSPADRTDRAHRKGKARPDDGMIFIGEIRSRKPGR